MKSLLLIGLTTVTSLFCMQPFISPFGQLNCSFTTVKRTVYGKIPTLIYDATLNDGTQIQAYVYEGGSFARYNGLRYKDAHQDQFSLMQDADVAFLQRLYPSFQSAGNTPGTRYSLYNHLLVTLDAEFVQQHPEQSRKIWLAY